MQILERIRYWATVSPDRPAHISGGRRITYGELWRRSEALAAHLLLTVPRDSSPIAVRGHKEPEMLVAFLACVKAGHPYIPLDSSVPEERVQRIILSANASEVLQADALPQSAGVVDPHAWVQEHDPYYIIYTSGSTGEPKGVQISRGSLENFIAWMLEEQKLDSHELFLNQAPFSFDLSVMDLYLSLTSGGTLYSLTRSIIEAPKLLFGALAESGITTWVSTPSFAVMCLAEKSFSQAMLPTLRRFLFCGETLPVDCAAQLLHRFPGAEVWNTYGPTEATVATTSIRVDKTIIAQHQPLPVGRSKPGSRILLMADGQVVPDGERGEIVIAGPNVALGYLNNPEQTARAFFTLDGQRAYRTGDWGRLRDGQLFWEGRMDFQVKLHGYRIELGEIESHLRVLQGVEDAVVLPHVREGKAEWLAAFVLHRDRPEGSDFAVGQLLRQKLATRLPAYMIPRKFFILPSFPMTDNGKADRRKLGEMLQ